MKFSLSSVFQATVLAGAVSVSANGYPWERLNKTDALLLILDMQEGLTTGMARDSDVTLFKNAMFAHGALGKTFDLPVVMTTSAQSGPNGQLPQEFLDWYPTAPLIQRQGEVDAWDNADFRAAVRAANKSQIIVAGIVTDVCTQFLARSLRAEGYSVWANIEASGTTTGLIRDTANDDMRSAGVHVTSLFAIVCDLMRDWRNTPGAVELLTYFDTYLPAYGFLARAHKAAVLNGTIISGEDVLPN